MDYEYKCVGAPERPRRSRRAKTPSDRLASAMQKIIEEEAVNGWEYMRTDLLPVTEKSSFLGRTQEVHRAVMVFRRDLEARRSRSGDRTARREDATTDLFDQPVSRRRPAARPAEDVMPDQPSEEPRVAVPAVEERPRRTKAVPAEEPIRLTVDDMPDGGASLRGRDRSTPSGLG